MTRFIYPLTGETIEMKNNINNIQKGHYIRVSTDDSLRPISGVVDVVRHVVNQHHNGNGLERSTHDIEIIINPS